ncbi:MAG: hypothetical protein ACTSRG_24835 [Candidatus Helarchaeota archaeon]
MMKIRILKEKDIPQIEKLLLEGFPDIPSNLWKFRFKMWWKENPAMNPSIPRGWILENDKSEIVGFLGNIPVKYLINGNKDIATAATSWYVKPALRGTYSFQLMLAFIKQKNIKLFVNTTPSEKSKRILSKIGFSRYIPSINWTEYFYILNYYKIFELSINRVVESKQLLFIIKILSTPIKLIIPFIQWLNNKRTIKAKYNEYYCSICSKCDDTFTELWEKTKEINATTLYRDTKTLNWLCFSKAVADKRYLIKCMHSKSHNMVGYFIYDIVSFPPRNIKIMSLQDTFVPKVDEKIISQLISFSINLAKNLEVAAIRLWSTNKEMDKMMKKHIKIHKKYKFEYFYKFHNINNLTTESLIDYKFIPSPIDPDKGTL